jgi:hypothetical protein
MLESKPSPIARLGTAYFERTAGFVVGLAGGQAAAFSSYAHGQRAKVRELFSELMEND